MTALLTAAPHSWEEFAGRLGRTPLVPVHTSLRGREHVLLLKLEGGNPFGSIKDRTAYGLLDAMEQRSGYDGPLAVVESTSGNLGVALAALCRLRGHTFVAVIDPKVQTENLTLMAELGAELELVTEADENNNYLAGRLARVHELLAADHRLMWTNQYGNVANPLAHARSTAPEIHEQAGHVEIVFAPVSTGGIAAGLCTYFRCSRQPTRVIAVDVSGSVAIGGCPGPRYLTGIGANVRSRFVRPDAPVPIQSNVDGKVWASDADAVALCRKLKDETGLEVGGSSGAALAACLDHLRAHPATVRPVCVCPDSGWKYWDSVYDDGWAGRNGLDIAEASARFSDEGIRFSCSTSM
ncbi:cysteine synthase [Kibdelosporangium banguiense]|uniref:Cysteine synthase n=1 Tax=Kibdelosporangium banguiense TaxID=1365924 RepID=A0ABS4TTN3_9PSEU|nr:pyridoxal-phosphate dependent enzyme [Kibdelosporangium banguiense]MBP2327308.1 cysteine synthase [Kibdelosporangium banguiense]